MSKTMRLVVPTYPKGYLDVSIPKDVNLQDQYGNYPLMYAVAEGDIDKVSVLLENGANIDSRNQMLMTPIIISGSHLSYRDMTTSGTAGVNPDIDVVRLLHQHGANFNDQDVTGYTMLHYLAGNYPHNLSVVQYVLQHQANPNILNIHGMSPLDEAYLWIARGLGIEFWNEVILLLVRYGGQRSKMSFD